MAHHSQEGPKKLASRWQEARRKVANQAFYQFGGQLITVGSPEAPNV
jgi:predicted oxidoreductase